jgi:hypothetical protein
MIWIRVGPILFLSTKLYQFDETRNKGEEMIRKHDELYINILMQVHWFSR